MPRTCATLAGGHAELIGERGELLVHVGQALLLVGELVDARLAVQRQRVVHREHVRGAGRGLLDLHLLAAPLGRAHVQRLVRPLHVSQHDPLQAAQRLLALHRERVVVSST